MDGDDVLHIRTGLKSECDEPVYYYVSMRANDWLDHIERAFPGMQVHSCDDKDEAGDISCLFILDEDHPMAGWDLNADAKGITWAKRIII